MGQEVKVEVKEPAEGAAEEAEGKSLLGMARKVLLAGIGAMALTQEEAERFVDKLVERGEIAEKDGKNLVRDMMERRRKDSKRAEDQMDKRIEDLLHRMNVPSKADIEALSAKITALTKKVDELKQG
jgi:poly(hydroxyalkanoate) granule-associated protein